MEKYCGEFDHKANVLLQVFKSSGMYFVNSLTLPVLIHVSYFFYTVICLKIMDKA